MNNEKSFAGIFFGGALKSNPVLIHCVALCPVIIASSNLGDSFFIALALTADLLISSFIASAMLKKVPRFIRVAIYLLIGLAIICPVLWIIENKTLINLPLGMRVFLPLIAVNSATALHCETYAVKNPLSSSIKAALASALGISLVLVICGALREIIGKGSLLGNEFHFAFTLPGMSMPFAMPTPAVNTFPAIQATPPSTSSPVFAAAQVQAPSSMPPCRAARHSPTPRYWSTP